MSDGLTKRLAMSDGLTKRLAMSDGLTKRLAMSDGLTKRLAMSDGLTKRLAMSDGLTKRLAMSLVRPSDIANLLVSFLVYLLSDTFKLFGFLVLTMSFNKPRVGYSKYASCALN
jgi:hypothetical protein